MSNWRTEIESIHVRAIKKSGIRPWSKEDVRFLALALCGECGELANILKKEWRGDFMINEEKLTEIRHELADIAVYTHLLCAAFGVDADDAITMKLPHIRNKFLQEPRNGEDTGGDGKG